MKRIIGMSTGAIYRFIKPVSCESIETLCSLGCFAIEIACLRKKELVDLEVINPSHVTLNLQHLSLHAPTDITYGNNDETKRALDIIARADERLNLDHVVFHPDTVLDWPVLKKMPFPVTIENSDKRKGFGKTTAEIRSVICGTDLGFVLDLNHCFSNDKSMDLASDMVRCFERRLCEIHLSGFANEYHAPIHITLQEEILRAALLTNAPIIIESPCADMEEARRELEYVKKFFDAFT